MTMLAYSPVCTRSLPATSPPAIEQTTPTSLQMRVRRDIRPASALQCQRCARSMHLKLCILRSVCPPELMRSWERQLSCLLIIIMPLYDKTGTAGSCVHL